MLLVMAVMAVVMVVVVVVVAAMVVVVVVAAVAAVVMAVPLLLAPDVQASVSWVMRPVTLLSRQRTMHSFLRGYSSR
jgi:hypothetical protein